LGGGGGGGGGVRIRADERRTGKWKKDVFPYGKPERLNEKKRAKGPSGTSLKPEDNKEPALIEENPERERGVNPKLAAARGKKAWRHRGVRLVCP